MTELFPNSVEAFQAALSDPDQSVICGARTKIRLPDGELPSRTISTSSYAGVVEHQANDFTITARAGTRVAEVADVLATKGQHLPFDPTFVSQGATIGGMIGSGFNGPCRLRYGGLKDFIIGCQFLNGRGTVVRAGGKVVKNAAGFDIPKFFVGSAGRFGLLLEATFKVFPRPTEYLTLIFPSLGIQNSVSLVSRIQVAAECEAIDLDTHHVAARISGESAEVLSATKSRLSIAEHSELLGDEDSEYWRSAREFAVTMTDEVSVRVPLVLEQISTLEKILDERIERRYTVAGNLALLKLPKSSLAELDMKLQSTDMTGQVIVGPAQILGRNKQLPFLSKLKKAFDPMRKFGD